MWKLRCTKTFGCLCEANVFFRTRYNQIEGLIPEDLPKCVSLRAFDVSHNKVAGDISDINFQQLTKMRTFMINHNPGIIGELQETTITYWVDIEYLSIFETNILGHVSGLCRDLPICMKYQFDSAAPQTWATEELSAVAETISLAKSNTEQARWTSAIRYVYNYSPFCM